MKVHLIGIGGTGMGALAGLLKRAGHDVRGSDAALYPPMSDQLRALGVPLFEGFGPENLDWAPDQVVVGNVCRKDHVEVVAAQGRGLPLTSFPALLSEAFLKEKHSIVVAGTHGKTTTSALLAHVFVDCGRDPSFLVGGVPQNMPSGWRLGQGPEFVVEGDEYDSAFFDKGSKFLHYRPETAILTSVELDHVDIFDSLDDVKAAFHAFVRLLPPKGLLLVAQSSSLAVEVASTAGCRVETYALVGKDAGRSGTGGERANNSSDRPVTGGDGPFDADQADRAGWQASLIDSPEPARSRFRVTRHGEYVGNFEIGLTGGYNVENALAVIAVCVDRGLPPQQIARSMARFRGVKRRQELRGIAAGVSVFDDYGHHPTAIRETLAAFRRRTPSGKLVALYEPRSATSRRATFQAEFAQAFADADEVVVGPMGRMDAIAPEDRFSRERLVADLRSDGIMGRVFDDIDALVQVVAGQVKPGDSVVVFSSGSFDGVHDKLLRELGDPIRPARVETMARVRYILSNTGLQATAAGDDCAGDFFVVTDNGDLVVTDNGDLVVTDNGGLDGCADPGGDATGQTAVGCVAVSQFDDTGVLRALAVLPSHRGRGLGWMLADNAVRQARAWGIRRLYLLTESASDFFAEKLGFRVIDRAIVDPAIAESPLFAEAEADARSVAMRLDL